MGEKAPFGESVLRREKEHRPQEQSGGHRERANVRTLLLPPRAEAVLLDDLCSSSFLHIISTKVTFGDSFFDILSYIYFISFGPLSIPPEPFSDTNLGRQNLLFYSNFHLSLRLKENLSFSYVLGAQLIECSIGQSNNINAHFHFLKHV